MNCPYIATATDTLPTNTTECKNCSAAIDITVLLEYNNSAEQKCSIAKCPAALRADDL